MKKLRILLCIVVVFSLLGLAACVDNTPPLPQLSYPINLSEDDGMLSWQEVQGAVSYRVRVVNGDSFITEDCYFGLDEFEYGTYVFRVQAVADGIEFSDSDWSDAVQVVLGEVDDGVEPQKLDTPTNIEYNQRILSWFQVLDASSYDIDIDGEIYVSLVNSLPLPYLAAGTYTVKVKAIGDGGIQGDGGRYFLNSDYSQPVQITVSD